MHGINAPPMPDPFASMRAGLSLCIVGMLIACGGGGSGNSQQPQASPTAPVPTVTLTAIPERIVAGQTALLSWAATDASECTADGAWSGTLSGRGNTGIVATETAQYSITCRGDGGTSARQTVTIEVPFGFEQSQNSVNDAAWHRQQGLFYLALGSDAYVHPNSIIAFNPDTGAIEASVHAGSEPAAVAVSDNGSYLYVGFRGADVIRRFRLPEFQLDIEYSVDPGNRIDHDEPKFTDQLAVAPENDTSVAVATKTYRTLPAGTQLQIFDDASARPYGFFSGDANSIAWGSLPDRLFASGFAGDVSVVSTNPEISQAGSTEPADGVRRYSWVTYHDGRLFDGMTGVFNEATLDRIGSLSHRGLVTVDPEDGTVFVAQYDSGSLELTITSHEPESYAVRDQIVVTKNVGGVIVRPGELRRMVRFGADGLALVGSFGKFAILRGPFVASGSPAVPTPIIPGTDPCCVVNTKLVSPLPTVTETGVYANDLVWDATHELLLASIPMNAPNFPSSIAVIDPSTGLVISSVTTAAEPGALAVSDDGQYLYVATALMLQRFTLPSLSLDAGAGLPDSARQTDVALPGSAPDRMAVRPGDPQTVAIDGRTVMSNLIPVEIPYSPASILRWSADGELIFGFDGVSLQLWSAEYGSTEGVTALGTPFGHPFPTNANQPPSGITFFESDGVLFSETGAIFDPESGGWPGTLPMGPAVGITDPSGASFAIGPIVVDSAARRAYSLVCTAFGSRNAVCGNSLVVFDIDTYLPLAIGGTPAIEGWAFGLYRLDSERFAVLTARRQVVLVSSSGFDN